MPQPTVGQQVQTIPLKMVGGVHYGRYNTISDEQSWNLIVSDNWMVPYAGYKNVITLDSGEVGRGLYASYRANVMFAVIGDNLYSIDTNLAATFIANLFTNENDVYIAENNNGQICITDGVYVYVYNYSTGTFSTSNPAITTNYFVWPFPSNPPGYVSFQNGRLIIAVIGSTNWALSAFNNATSWSSTNSAQVGSLQTKPDYVQAAVPMPGKGNNLLVFGRNVAELWTDVGAALFPYQRSTNFNVDYGCINPASIAFLNQYIVWLAVNEQSGPVLMVAEGNNISSISTDGIDYKLGNLTNPTNCTGFLFQQDGHLLYQFTFPDDNISYAYDFNTKLFFSVSDEDLNYHIARQVVYFNNTYYFVSLNGGNIYEFDTIYPTAEYSPVNIRILPRIRITSPFQFPDQDYFVVRKLTFPIEMGQPNNVSVHTQYSNSSDILATEAGDFIGTEDGDTISTEETFDPVALASWVETDNAVFLSVSRDGGINFGSQLRTVMNPTGVRKNMFNVQRVGVANNATYQWRFVGTSRFVFTDGLAEIYT